MFDTPIVYHGDIIVKRFDIRMTKLGLDIVLQGC